jgi:hypothetical protein
MTQTLAAFGLGEVATGVMPGLDEDKVPLWSRAQNVLCDQFGVRPSPGYTGFSLATGFFDIVSGDFDDALGLFDDLSPGVSVVIQVNEVIRGLSQTRNIDTNRKLYYGTLTRLFANDGTEVDVSRPTPYGGFADQSAGQSATYWSMAHWGDWAIATNGFDEPQIYKNTGTFGDLPDIQCTKAELVFVLGPHLILANTSNGPNVVEWSAQDNPEQWDFATYVTAGRRIIRTFEGPIIAAVPLGRAYMLYGENQAHVMQYGGQFTFSTLPGPKGCGAVSKNSVVAVGNANFGIMPEGIFTTDGVQVQWITYPQLGRWLIDNIDWEQGSKVSGWYDPEARCIRWALPRKDDPARLPSIVLVCNLAANGALTFETEAFTVGSERGGIGYSLVGTANGQVLAQRWDAAKPNRLLETKFLDLGTKDLRKYLDALRVMSEGTNFQVSVGFAEAVQGTVDWQLLGAVADLTETTFYFMRDSVYVKVRIECSDVNANWRVSGLEILGKPTGRRY